ncbi:inositol transporter 4 [Amaranthus tricolor]|uniref:inositol transporter 4 n=1 Tax=Amaranthus tricolor TaxID=29722 RepID=UPI0025902B55|nr:inositol transporter 4 [Amaranthus tricolor]
MVEGGIIKADKTEFTECFRTIRKTPYIMRIAFSAGIGGLLFGYDTGVISGALLYIREDFKEVQRKTWLQETIVSTAVAGAIIGAGVGGWLNDKIGRKPTIIIADILFFIGALIMASAPAPWMIILGRIFVGLGVGMASMTSPLYISETSPTRIRGALVSTNGLLITGGQFLSYLINLGFTQVKGTWRWMLGVAAVPAFLQFILMLSLPESPRWLYRKGKVSQAEAILARIYPEEELEDEKKALKASIDSERAQEESFGGGGVLNKVRKVWENQVFRRGLYAGVTVQVAQQFVGINTIMYYSPTIVQLAGFASKSTALALSLITAGLNAVGSIVSMMFVDRHGRRRLMIVSMFGIITCLVVLAIVFYQAAEHAPSISYAESTHFGLNSTCPAFNSAQNPASWNCMTCLKSASHCAFCANKAGNGLHPGACLRNTDDLKDACNGQQRVYFTEGCPSKLGYLAVILLGVYIISYSPGMGTVPWIVNSEIYPLRYRGIGGGIAAVANWTSNLIVSETFLTLTQALGSAGTFLLFAGFSVIGFIFIYLLVPETKGLPIEEVEHMLEKGYKPKLFGGCQKSEQKH